MINQEECKTCAYNLDCDRVFCPKEIQIPESEPAPAGGLMGWICPVCGRGLSPYTSSCPCAINRKITYGTGTVNCQDAPTENFKEDKSRCYKCVHESGCSKNLDSEGLCHAYKRDPKDGGFYDCFKIFNSMF